MRPLYGVSQGFPGPAVPPPPTQVLAQGLMSTPLPRGPVNGRIAHPIDNRRRICLRPIPTRWHRGPHTGTPTPPPGVPGVRASQGEWRAAGPAPRTVRGFVVDFAVYRASNAVPQGHAGPLRRILGLGPVGFSGREREVATLFWIMGGLFVAVYGLLWGLVRFSESVIRTREGGHR